MPVIPVLIPALSDAQRLVSVLIVVTIALAFSGMLGSSAGGAPLHKGTLRVLIGGWLAMALTYGVGMLLNVKAP